MDLNLLTGFKECWKGNRQKKLRREKQWGGGGAGTGQRHKGIRRYEDHLKKERPQKTKKADLQAQKAIWKGGTKTEDLARWQRITER